jgi:N-acetylglucosaminyl-diphospho-decaprenol L-rhamnosyltransferase
MPDRPDVSICIVNWNGRELLRNLLESLKTDEPGLRLETIVVDNASTDGSLDRLPADFADVVLVRNERNLGFARANNQAAEHATGRYLFFLNNDTLVRPGALGRLVRFMDEHPAYSAVGPKLIGGDGKPQLSARNLPTIRALLHHRVMLFPRWTGVFRQEYRDYRYGDFDPDQAADVQQLAAAALLVRPEHFEAAGRWDEGFEFGVEDVDLCVRLRKQGPIYYLPEAIIDHLGRISSQANYGFTYTGYECGYARYLKKHHPDPNAARVYKTLVTVDMPVRLFILGSQAIGYVLFGRRDAAARTYRRLSAAGEFFFHRMPKFWRA